MISQSLLKQLLSYDAETGIFTWLVNRRGRFAKIGARAGHDGERYREIGIDGSRYREQHLAFLYMVGYIPEEVDHKDLNKKNNKWRNLRECTRSQNMANTGLRSTNTSGFKGVHFDKSRKKWVARIKINYETKMLGRFSAKNAAAAAYRAAASAAFGEFARFEKGA